MLRVKTFDESSLYILEQKINDFIKGIDLIHIQYQVTECSYTALILFNS